MAAGCALLTRFDAVLIVPWLATYVAADCRGRRHKAGALVALLVVVLAFVAIQAGWNLYRFGSAVTTGAGHKSLLRASFSGDLAVSLPSNLFSANRSVFVFSPPLLLALVCFGRLISRFRSLAICIIGVALTNLVFFSKFLMWSATTSWGPRFLVPTVPLLLPVCLSDLRSRWRRLLTMGVLVAGALVQLVAVLRPYAATAIAEYWGEDAARPIAHPLKSEIVPQAMAIIEEGPDLWWMASPLTAAVGLVLVVLGAILGWLLVRNARSLQRTTAL